MMILSICTALVGGIAQPTAPATDSSQISVAEEVCVGRVYPERADDFAWENDIVAFRAYGPATRAKGEKAYGYDIFFKHPGKGAVLDILYANSTDPRRKEKIDSVRINHPEQYQSYKESFNLHRDHGYGYDCYAVGPTLGAGVAARLQGDSIVFPWCYERAEILEKGPDRITFRLDFPPADSIVEHRLISLGRGSHLNNTNVWYESVDDREMADSIDIVVGFPLRDESPVYCDNNILAYADPTQGDGNGKALLGIILDRTATTLRLDSHILLSFKINPKEPFSYRWGYAWSKADIASLAEWIEYLKSVKNE